MSPMLLKPLFKSLFNKERDDFRMDISRADRDVLQAILIRCSKEELVHCREVCRKWKELIDSRSFWIAKEEFDGEDYIQSLIQTGLPFISTNFSQLSVLRPFNHNLLKKENLLGKTDVEKHADSRWKFTNGGNGWRYESPPSFLSQHFHQEFKPLFDGCLATSYGWCSKMITLKLSDIGIDDKIMDENRPPIVFSEWVANRSDCGSEYKISIQLCNNENDELAVDRSEINFQQWTTLQIWQKAEVSLQHYPAGARVLKIYSASKDTQFWNGHYGAKIAGSELIIKMESSFVPDDEYGNYL